MTPSAPTTGRSWASIGQRFQGVRRTVLTSITHRSWSMPDRGAIKRSAITVWMVGPMVTLPVALGYAVHRRSIDPRAVAALAGGYVIAGLGVTAGYHRLLTHRSYRTTSPRLEAIVLLAGAMAGQGPPSQWAGTHTTHHSHTDKPGDPHSPHVDFDDDWRGVLRGFVHAQVGWLYEEPSPTTTKHVERIRAGSATVRWIDDHYLAILGAGLLAPGLVAGWQGVVWGGVVRMLLVNHATFAVNSICHMYGQRRFETDDESRNNTFIALLTQGEGNHNNHHAFPKMAYHGIGWREYDLTAYVLRWAEARGLITDVVKPTPVQIAERIERLRLATERRVALAAVAD
jgi:stearoyl-CoA desaturase (delta-9 desaturase)